VLSELGFVERPQPFSAMAGGPWWHANPWVRDQPAAVVDLHHRFHGAIAAPEVVWTALSAHTEKLMVAGVEVTVLDEAARCLHAATHAAQNSNRLSKPLDDLQRALARAPMVAWEEAARLAAEVGAVEEMAVGLHLVREGSAMAERLGLPTERPMSFLLREEPLPPTTGGIAWAAELSGGRERVRFALRKVFPGSTFLRAWAPRLTARPGGWFLAAVGRPVWLVVHAPRAVVAWRRLRRSG